MIWLYDGKEIVDEDLEGYKSFVYRITNLDDGRMYIGKKRLHFTKKRRVSGKRNRVVTVKESDWRKYYGSSDELKSDVARLGETSFKREILRLCRSLSESNYYELREQMVTDALLKPELYYNAYVGSRISRKQLGVKK